MKMRHCQFFRAGEEVPSWLLDVEPTAASGQRPAILWTVDAHVIETERGFFVVPMELGTPSVMAVQGGNDAAIFATSREVIVPFRFQIMTPDGEGRDEQEDPKPPVLSGANE